MHGHVVLLRHGHHATLLQQIHVAALQMQNHDAALQQGHVVLLLLQGHCAGAAVLLKVHVVTLLQQELYGEDRESWKAEQGLCP